MSVGEVEVATITTLKRVGNREEKRIKPQQSRQKQKLLFMWNKMNSREGQNFAPAHPGGLDGK